MMVERIGLDFCMKKHESSTLRMMENLYLSLARHISFVKLFSLYWLFSSAVLCFYSVQYLLRTYHELTLRHHSTMYDLESIH